MKTKKTIIYLYALIFIEVLILIKSNIVIENVKQSLKIFTQNIFPTLFPNMITASLLSKYDISIIIPKKVKLIFKKFCNFDQYKTSIFILCLLSGSPTSSIILNNYYKKNLITYDDLKYLSYVTQFINPLFIIGFVGIKILGSKKIGFILFLLLLLTNIIKAHKIKKYFSVNEKKDNQISNLNITKNLIDSVNNSISSSLIIFSLIIIFNIITCLITQIFNLNDTTNFIINSILEITGGLNKLKTLNLNIYIKFILCYILLNFGSISINLQTLLLNENKKIRYLKYLISRIIYN